MKNIILSFIFLLAISLTSCSNKSKNQTTTTSEDLKRNKPMKEISFGVRGNCGMCKTTIEKAATNLDGVSCSNMEY